MGYCEFFETMLAAADKVIVHHKTIIKNPTRDTGGLVDQIDELNKLLNLFSEQLSVLKNIIFTQDWDNADMNKLVQKHKEQSAKIADIVEALCA